MIQIFISEDLDDPEAVKFFYIINEKYYKCIYSWIEDVSHGHISEWTTLVDLREIASSKPYETISKEEALDLIENAMKRQAHNKFAYDTFELFEKVQEALLVF
jgi:hypothetical protein